MRYRIDPDKTVWRKIDSEIVMLNLDSGHYYKLNKTGTFIWSALCEQESIPEIINRVNRRYSIPKERAREDVLALIKALEREGLVYSMDR